MPFVAEERLQKVLARLGAAPSRRKAEEWIRAGRVYVNGKVAHLGSKVSERDDISIDREHIKRKALKPRSFALYKPVGIVTSKKDTHGRKTVMDIVPRVKGLHPVGRLDKDSEGLIILTNLGDLTLELTHPRFEHEKEYRIWCRHENGEGGVTESVLAKLVQGFDLEDGFARAVSAKPARGGATIVLTQGRKRQLRRMLAHHGYQVERLLRTRIGRLTLQDARPGDYWELSKKDIALLRKAMQR